MGVQKYNSDSTTSKLLISILNSITKLSKTIFTKINNISFPVDQTVIQNSTNAVSGGGVFDFVQVIPNPTTNVLPKKGASGFVDSLISESGTNLIIGNPSLGHFLFTNFGDISSRYDNTIRVQFTQNHVDSFGAGYGVNANGGFRIGNGFTFSYITASGTDLILQAIEGKVGIGTTTPTEALDVNGSIKLSNLLKLGQFTTATEPAYVKGASFFNTILNKSKIGGETIYETQITGTGTIGKIQKTSAEGVIGDSAISEDATNVLSTKVLRLASGLTPSNAQDLTTLDFFNNNQNVKLLGTTFFAGSKSNFSNFDSNFFGQFAGNDATNSSGSNFFGSYAGSEATNANNSNFFGLYAGQNAEQANDSNFFGTSSGNNATNAPYSNFFGTGAGSGATNASNSNFYGAYAGDNATNAYNSNFFGAEVGSSASYANDSNFFGAFAGYAATNASNSNFSGMSAGSEAANANDSNFFGSSAGNGATNASYSNFFGLDSGNGATNASASNFFGYSAGNGATNAYNSNFFGNNAGVGSVNASSSNLFGVLVGRAFSGNSLGNNNIIIGTNISLPNLSENCINLGGVLFGKNTFSSFAGDCSIVAQSNGKIGINVVDPTEALDVLGNGKFSGKVTASPATLSTELAILGQITKAQVGLSNVDNTSDANKPISTAQQTALNARITGSGTINRVPKFTASGAVGNSGITELPSGNVGIGTSSPDATLHVEDNRFTTMIVKGNEQTRSGELQILNNLNRGISLNVTGSSYASGLVNDARISPIGTGANTISIGFTRGAGTPALIANVSNNNVGINQTNPTERLDVIGNGKFSGTLSCGQFTTATEPAYVKGASFFNTTLNKMRIGGATAYETVTSS